MVKISLQIKAVLEDVEEFYTNQSDYVFLLKLKCTSCGENSDKWHDVTESLEYAGKTGKSKNHFIAKCKLCGRENSLDIIPGTYGKYTNDDQGKFKTIVTFDCRGIEPTDFSPSVGWIAKVTDSGKIFENISLTDKEWADYDEKSQKPVGIYEIESKFITVK